MCLLHTKAEFRRRVVFVARLQDSGRKRGLIRAVGKMLRFETERRMQIGRLASLPFHAAV